MFPFKVTSWVFLYSKVKKSLWSLHEGEEASEVTQGKKLSTWTICVPFKGQCWRWKRSTLYPDHRVSIIFLLQLNMPAVEKFGPQKALVWIYLSLVPSFPVWMTNYKCGRRGNANAICRVEEPWQIGSLSNIPIIQNFEVPTVWMWKEIAALWILCFPLVIWVDDDTKYLVWNWVCCIFMYSETWARLECWNHLWIFSSLPTVNV